MNISPPQHFHIFILYNTHVSNYNKNSIILHSYFNKCWKIALNEPVSIAEQMESLHFIEVEEFKAQQNTVIKRNVKVKINLKSTEQTTLPFSSKIQCRLHQTVTFKITNTLATT